MIDIRPPSRSLTFFILSHPKTFASLFTLANDALLILSLPSLLPYFPMLKDHIIGLGLGHRQGFNNGTMSSSNRPALIIAFCLCFFILATVYYSIDSSYTQQSFRTTYKHTSDPHGSTSDSYYYDRKYGKDSSHYEQEYMDSRIENVRNQTLGVRWAAAR